MAACCVLDCDSTPENSNITFHKIPIEDESTLKIWLTNLNQESWTLTSESRICSKHFDEDSFEIQDNVKVLKPSALPLQTMIDETIPSNYGNSLDDSMNELVDTSDYKKELFEGTSMEEFKEKDDYLEDGDIDSEEDDEDIEENDGDRIYEEMNENDGKTEDELADLKTDVLSDSPTTTDLTAKKVVLKYDDYKKLTDPREKINCLRQIIGNQRRKIKTYYQHLRRRQLKIDNYEKLLIEMNIKHRFNSEADMKTRTTEGIKEIKDADS